MKVLLYIVEHLHNLASLISGVKVKRRSRSIPFYSMTYIKASEEHRLNLTFKLNVRFRIHYHSLTRLTPIFTIERNGPETQWSL